MLNIIPPDHVDDVPIVEPNQHDDVPVVLESVLVDEDEDPEEEEFEEEEEAQEKEDDIEVDIKEDENEPELRYPYEEMDHLNPPSPASESEHEDVIEVENSIEHEDKTVTASVHEIGELFTAPFLREDSDGLLPSLIRRDISSLLGRMSSLSRRLYGCETAHALVEKKKAKDEYYGKLILDLGNKVCFSVKQGTTEMEKLVERLGSAEEKSWVVRAHEFYQEMIRRGFVFEERQNKAIDVSIKDEKSPSSEREDLLVILSSLVSIVVSLLIMPLKSAPLTQAAIRRMIKESIDAAIAAERARHANAGNDARGSGPVRGQDSVHFVRECTFTGFMKCNPIAFHEGKKVKFATATLQGPALTWRNAKVAAMGLETVNQMPWTEMKHLLTAKFLPTKEVQRMVHEPWNLKFKEYNIVAYTQSKEFLEELQMNAYHGWIDEDMINHIAMVHKMIDSIHIPSVDYHQLRMKIFSLLLADEAKQWWMNEGDGKITVWEELVKKIFVNFIPNHTMEKKKCWTKKTTGGLIHSNSNHE
uniref:Reverse transcriptase domain-containing protein n=1 Tax=Tanacetum cinerariifolium TaxID=118510 RepID=A0A699HFP0_TANCI|nr:hypothetical protein [Tanacetum cinerariifolium]